MARVVRWTKDPRKKPRPKAPTIKPDVVIEVYPRTCSGCGQRVTQNTGYVEHTDAVGGARKYCSFGCDGSSASRTGG